jgi:hypothetical protein
VGTHRGSTVGVIGWIVVIVVVILVVASVGIIF